MYILDFDPPWYILEDKAATWDEPSSGPVLPNLQTLQFLFKICTLKERIWIIVHIAAKKQICPHPHNIW